ncbi:frm-4 [Pristionchus pacificus]|uniref:Frm-4 n=1 Tax=Pristionchus pacificus TaxID=54126 RepID=A0A2A6BUG1_PRIPA|nr:frm-4 [Pristionchus pacificus]|eukprot:PDM69554.1 frm-4 [Pristionchus pacificus]
MERNNNNKSTSSLFGRMSARASFISKKEIKVTIQLLNDADTINNEFKKSSTGKDVLDYVCEFLNITEKDYFGLRYQDHHRHRYWVDLTQPLSTIAKLFKSENIAFRLRFRYYPSSAGQLREEITRYQLNVQLQRDLLHGRLYCPQPIGAQLAAYILQSQVGDVDASEADGARYVSEYKLLLKQTPKLEEKIAELHQGLRGTSAADAELRMIEMACQLETYGFDPYTVKDPKNGAVSVYIGATHRGILVFHGSQKAHHMQWSEVTKIDYTGNELRIYPCEGYEPMVELENGPIGNGVHNSILNQTHTSESMLAANQTELDKENETSVMDKSAKATHTKMLRYLCPSRTFAKHLWVHLLSQKAFFNETTSEGIKPLFSKPRIPLFTRGSTFRFPAQRVLKEIETSPVEERPSFSFARYELPKQTPRTEMPTMTKYQTLPNMKLNGHLRNGSTGGGRNGSVSSPTEEKKIEVFMDEASSSLGSAPSPSSSPPTVISTATTTLTSNGLTTANGGPNVTGRRRETSPSRVVEEENNNWTKHLDISTAPSAIGEPIATSTPKVTGAGGELTKRRVNGVNGGVKGDEKRSKQVEDKPSVSVSSTSSSPSLISRLINFFFLIGLFLLIIVFAAIVLFERQESTSFVESQPWLMDVRRVYYQPIKEVAMKKYNAAFSR